jgi:ferredoxin-NADP reductase/DMSO/TMAO reductase YedYZ heme-binding membrane subunit
MPASERFVDTPFLKRLVAVTALVPAALLVWDGWHGHLGVNSVNFVIRTTGLIGLVLIVASLLVTPVRELTGWGRVIATRRRLGVIGFAYLAVHFATFVLFDRQASLSSTVHEIVTRRYLWFGTGALALMVPLTLTSTDAMVARLGATAWKRLHRLAYLVAIGAVIHYYLLVKSNVTQPLAFAAAVGLLLLYRLGSHYVGLRKAAAAIRPRVADLPRPPLKPRVWSGELVVSRIFDETPDVKTFRLAAVDGGPLPFAYHAGQYLNLALTIDGARVNRSYTIASAPSRAGHCEISVKQAADGHGSRHLHTAWRAGDRVKVSAPAGGFVFGARDVHRVVMIAGGIGITPLMSMIRSLTDGCWSGDVYLLYAVRTVADIAFRDELAWLARRHPNLHVQIVVSRDPETAWDGARGSITRAVIAGFVPNLTRGPVFLCGPAPMMAAMREILGAMGVPDAEVLQEAFVSRPPVDAAEAAAVTADAAGPLVVDGAASIVFRRANRTVDAAGDRTVLEAAEDAGVAIPYECRSGICGQCKTQLLSGRVTMEIQDALSAAERGRGLILACQARALQPLEIDA